MAREPPEFDDEQANAEAETAESPAGNTGLLHRRSYLQLAGAAVGGAAIASAAGRANAASYDVVEVDAGSHEVLRVGAGETLENVLIDVTADGASATIDCHAPNTTVRNVGFEGRMDSPPTGIIGASDTGGGTSVIENVYLGDGASAGHRHGLGLWVSPEHSGHLVIDRVNIQEMGDNSFYCSAPGNSGTVELRNCYSANSWVAHYRLAKGTVENCVALNDERHEDGRGIWAWAPGTVEVRDCDLDMNGRHYAIAAGANGSGTHVAVSDTQYSTAFHGGIREANGSTVDLQQGNGTNPDGSRIPDGCPTSAREAAAGGRTQVQATNRIELSGQFSYRIEVDGEIEPAAAHAQWLTEGDAYGDDWAEWWLSGSDEARTVWEYTGDITSLEVTEYDGTTSVRTLAVNGDELDHDRYVTPSSHTLSLAGQFSYRIEVDGEIEPAPAHAQWLTEGEAYGDDWAEWWLSGSDEARTVWEYTGDITSLDISPHRDRTEVRTFAIDGESVDPERFE
ncbi:hypothetical protein Halru_1621 [Halovivax ruber XH-70]|uniref:Right handed beta helix domain-containing protein n=1 Tax=Halovivax ruber (strain DSM 18193 / JCM 13892 / XH-70) TaxID=797302 RepID=L0IBN4_HALRX|nr:hypothetical protein [Halovivax ruber]AGB16228.1 hypothetical protein Halru_1621 [Halovivax ruber XH-70]